MDVHYPVSLERELDPNLSLWLWLVKWFLAITHYITLAFCLLPSLFYELWHYSTSSSPEGILEASSISTWEYCDGPGESVFTVAEPWEQTGIRRSA